MKVWVLHGECGDYYCGCGEGHLIGVTANYDEIPGLKKAAEGMTYTYGHGSWHHDYHSIHVTEVELGLVYPRNLSGVTRENTNRTNPDGPSLES
jgi:hypothetical protein